VGWRLIPQASLLSRSIVEKLIGQPSRVIMNKAIIKKLHYDPGQSRIFVKLFLCILLITLSVWFLYKAYFHLRGESHEISMMASEFYQTVSGKQDSPDALPIGYNVPPAIAGPLYIDPENPRYFTDGSGKAILLVGSHTWSNLVDGGDTDPPPVFNFTEYLDFLEGYNHNFFRLWRAENARGGEVSDDYWFTPMPYQRPGPGLGLDGKPKFDLNLFNQAYFDRMRARVMEAGQRGMYVSIMLFDGWSVESKFAGHNPWLGHPYNAGNNINGINGDPSGNGSGEETHTLAIAEVTALQEAYVRKVIDTVNDLDNVLYEISNESPGNSEDWQYHMINYIKGYEATLPKQHPVGMTVEWPGGDNGELFASSADWISPNGDVNNPPAVDGSKVVLNDTDHLCGVCGDRSWAWKSFTRGANPIFMDPYNGVDEGRGSFPNYDPNNPNDVSIRENLGYIRAYSERMNLEEMTPRGDLASSGYALANPVADGAEYLVYLPDGGSVTVNLGAASGELKLEWFRPADGTIIDDGVVLGGSTQSFTAPFGGDAALYIYDSDITTPTPDPNPTSTKTTQPSFTPTVKPDSTPTPTRTNTPTATSINSPTPDYQPPWIYNVKAIPFDVTTWVTWDTSEPATSAVFYGLSPSVLDTNIVSNEFVTNHTLELNDLSPSTKYYYVVSSKDLSGNETASEIKSFTTFDTVEITRVYFPDLLKFTAIQSTSP
jgi:hypothetical protein